jgi:hypothetical protein
LNSLRYGPTKNLYIWIQVPQSGRAERCTPHQPAPPPRAGIKVKLFRCCATLTPLVVVASTSERTHPRLRVITTTSIPPRHPAPNICANDGCDYTAEVEPDQDRAGARAVAPTPSKAPLYSRALSSPSLAISLSRLSPATFCMWGFSFMAKHYIR